jgi:hypothetical protein
MNVIPVLRKSKYQCAYGINENFFEWALEYAFNLGVNGGQDAESAARSVIQSLAGRNAIKIILTQVNGLTELTSIDGVSTRLVDLSEEVRKLREAIEASGLRVTKTEYEG